MPGHLDAATYGKTNVRLLRVVRESPLHTVADVSLHIAVEGDIGAAFVEGDNRNILPTDSMKNAVYALARTEPVMPIEQFGERLCRHFLSAHAPLSRVSVDIAQTPWDRRDASCFVGGGSGRRIARVTATVDSCLVDAGIDELSLLKTSRSAFSGFSRDAHTTLTATEDRVLSTSLRALWRYDAPVAYDACWTSIRERLIATFAGHASRSLQHTLYVLGEAILDGCADISSVTLEMPNQHCVAYDLSPFGLDNPNMVFVPVSQPQGWMNAKVTRR